MSFSPEWLALREPVDHAARSRKLLAAAGQAFADRATISVVDLGCGAGSNLRGTFETLPADQTWRLVDNDPALLATARERLATWADHAEQTGDMLRLSKAGRRLSVSFHQADLNGELGLALGEKPDLVTAAALFDLVSEAWIGCFVEHLAARRLPLYTVLTYDGTERWTPAHPADAAMVSAFHRHQTTDKGFGPAAGPRATAVMAEHFRARGYGVATEASPWHVGPEPSAFGAALVRGFAEAVTETGDVPADDIADWLALRLAGGSHEVGHLDLLAVPGS